MSIGSKTNRKILNPKICESVEIDLCSPLLMVMMTLLKRHAVKCNEGASEESFNVFATNGILTSAPISRNVKS